MSNKVILKGDHQAYELADDLKRYALIDTGFKQKSSGSFSFDRSLNGATPFAPGYRLKITVNRDFTNLKMAITDPSGLKVVDIFKNNVTAAEVEQCQYLLADLESRHVLKKV